MNIWNTHRRELSDGSQRVVDQIETEARANQLDAMQAKEDHLYELIQKAVDSGKEQYFGEFCHLDRGLVSIYIRAKVDD